MAISSHRVKGLQEAVLCSLCQEYFQDPVILKCGHNFCRACITRYCETSRSAASYACPQCGKAFGKGEFQPNRQLRNVVELTRRLPDPSGSSACKEHEEFLKLFCEVDQAPICLVCRESRNHKEHTVVPIDEAALEYKVKVQKHLESLKEREEILLLKLSEENKSQELLKQTQAERQKIVAEFQQLRHFLEEQEQLLLAQLQKLEEEIMRTQTDTVRKLSAQLSRLVSLIRELEGKLQKPASEFLKDVRSTLSRCEEGQAQQPEEMSPELEERIRGFSQKTLALSETLRTFKDTLPAERKGQPLGGHRPVNVTLDPDTAHPRLVLSQDGKHVSWGITRQQLPDTPERFDSWPCVLGREGFVTGRHCWEVEVADGQHWAVGVARASVKRKNQICLSPEAGIWAVELCWGEFQALSSPATPLLLSRVPSRIRVCLDCDQGQVTFIDAATEALIFTFPPSSLPGERIRPWLCMGRKAQLSLYP